MYLVSIYFDEKANKKIQRYIDQVAKETGNRFMLDGNVPPHMTVSAFEARNEEQAIGVFRQVARNLKREKVTWTHVGQFFPYVIFLEPILNQYLYNLSQNVYETFSKVDNVQISPYYRPYQWVPHTTVGKTLSKEEMKLAFEVLQNSFCVFEGEVVRIGLAKPNPHRDIESFELPRQ